MEVEIPEKMASLFEHHDLKGYHGGRGGGKSHSIAKWLIMCAGPYAEGIPSSSRSMIGKPELIGNFREIQKSIKTSSKKLLEKKIDELGYGLNVPGGYFTSTDQEIRGARGELFFFNGLRDASGSRSTEGMTKFWVEEAADVSQDSFEVLLPTLREQCAEGIFSWNPVNAEDAVDAYFASANDAKLSFDLDIISVEINYWDNPFFPDFLRKQMEYDRARDIDLYNHVWCGKHKRNSEARVFKNWSIRQFEAPKKTFFYFGGDWGFSNDPSVLVRMFVEGRTIYIDYEAYAVGCEIDDTPDLFETVPEAKAFPIRADSARPETISYMQKHGFPLMVPCTKGQNSVEEGVEFLKSYDIVVHPRCKHVIDELSFYSWVVDPKTKVITNKLEDKKNHTIDSIRYALEELRKSDVSIWAKLGRQ